MEKVIHKIQNFLTLYWITGPIFDKELRVASRRKRNYAVRSLYVVVLAFLITLIWMESLMMTSYPSAVYMVSRMSEAGKVIIVTVVWTQFIATQMLACIMLSTSISDEVYNKTLGVLVTTPINSFQIVMGKLLSKLLQILLIMALSLPLLSIVRVFGGVPWNFLISSFFINVVTVLFIGSISMFFSIYSKRAYLVIIFTVITTAVLFGLFPMLTGLCMAISRNFNEGAFFGFFYHINPYFSMGLETAGMMDPSVPKWFANCFWPIHCGIVLGGVFLVLSVCVAKVRKVAIMQIGGETDPVKYTSLEKQIKKQNKRIKAGETGKTPVQMSSAAVPDQTHFIEPQIRRVTGSPVLWKELRSPLLGKHNVVKVVFIVIGVLLLLLTYALFAHENALDDNESHMVYVAIFMGIGMFLSAILPATTVTSEKESRSWILLLSTTLSSWEIIIGKLLGTFRHLLPVWSILFAHVCLFVLVGYIHPLAIIHLMIITASTVILLTGSGLLASVFFRKTTTAVVINITFALIIWLALPFITLMICAISHSSDDPAEFLMDCNPMVQAMVVMEATASRSLNSFDWMTMGNLNAFENTFWLTVCLGGYSLAAIMMMWIAEHLLRKNAL